MALEKEFNFRNYGKMFKTFMMFVETVNRGEAIEIHSEKYVVMDRKAYERLVRRAVLADTRIIEEEK